MLHRLGLGLPAVHKGSQQTAKTIRYRSRTVSAGPGQPYCGGKFRQMKQRQIIADKFRRLRELVEELTAKPNGQSHRSEIASLLDGLETALDRLREDNDNLRRIQESTVYSERQYAELYDSAPVGYCTISKDGVITRANLTFASVVRTERENLVGTPFVRFVAKQSSEDFNNHARELLRTGRAAYCDLTMSREDDTMFSAHLECVPVPGDDGEVDRLWVSVVDFTDLKRAEDALRFSEQRFRQLFDHMSSGVAVYQAQDDGEDFVFRDFNQSAERIENVHREELIGKSVLEVFPGVKEFGLFEIFQRVYRTGKPERHPIRLYRDNRIQGWRDNYICRLPSGEVAAIYDDVTERMEAVQTLARSEERYRTLLTNLPVGVFRSSFSGRLLSVNPAMAAIFGYSDMDEMLATPVGQFYANPRQRRALMRQLLAAGSITDHELQVRRRDGSMIWVSVHVHAELGEDGKIRYLDGIIEDITDRKMARERERAVYQDKYEQARRIAGVFAHEVRNGLFPATAALRLLKVETSADEIDREQIRDYARAAERSVTQAAAATQLITSFTRLSTEVLPERVNLADVVSEIVDNNRQRLEAVDVRIDISGPQKVHVTSNHRQLGFALNNIVLNSIQALEGCSDPHISIEWKVTGQTVRLEIEDNGCGIPAENIDKIFQPFFSTKVTGGSGIGLSTTRRLIEMYDGTVAAASEEGSWTRFVVDLKLFE